MTRALIGLGAVLAIAGVVSPYGPAWIPGLVLVVYGIGRSVPPAENPRPGYLPLGGRW